LNHFFPSLFPQQKKGANSKMAEYWQRKKRGVLAFQYFFVLCRLLHERNSFYYKKNERCKSFMNSSEITQLQPMSYSKFVGAEKEGEKK